MGLATTSLLALVVASPRGLRSSADPGAPLVPCWVILLPVAVGLVAARLLPPRAPLLPPALLDRCGVQRALLVMVACALAFPALVELFGVRGSALHHLLEVVVLLVIPGLAAWWARGSISHPWKGDADVESLVGDLAAASGEFADLWALQEVAARRSTRKVVLHPGVGRLELECDVVISPPSGQRLVLFRPQPGTGSAQRLALLGVVGTQDLTPAPAER